MTFLKQPLSILETVSDKGMQLFVVLTLSAQRLKVIYIRTGETAASVCLNQELFLKVKNLTVNEQERYLEGRHI